VADDLDDLDETEGGPQPAEGRELVIVDLGHITIMPLSWQWHRAAALWLAYPGQHLQLHALRPRGVGPGAVTRTGRGRNPAGLRGQWALLGGAG
jgi:hypothetical protein